VWCDLNLQVLGRRFQFKTQRLVTETTALYLICSELVRYNFLALPRLVMHGRLYITYVTVSAVLLILIEDYFGKEK
jgi:hypothetical protein